MKLDYTNRDDKTAYEAYAIEEVEASGTCAGQSFDRAAQILEKAAK